MSKSYLVRETPEVEIGKVLCGQAAEEVAMIRRLDMSFYFLSCISLSRLYLHLTYYHALYTLTHLHT